MESCKDCVEWKKTFDDLANEYDKLKVERDTCLKAFEELKAFTKQRLEYSQNELAEIRKMGEAAFAELEKYKAKT